MAVDEFMSGILGLLLPGYAERLAREQAEAMRRKAQWLADHVEPLEWDDATTRFSQTVYVKASSWKPVLLFDVKPLRGAVGARVTAVENAECVRWCGQYFYVNHVLPKGTPLQTFSGRRHGEVYFDDDVVCPALCEKVPGKEAPRVWMGLTPMEVFTQRAGVIKARGRVVVGGLGLGWFLNAVASKRSVTEVVVVDRERALLDWLRPVICEKYPEVARKVTGWECRDIYEFMEEDVPLRKEGTRYLLDIWPRYGEYDQKFEEWKKQLGKNIWGWGDVF